MTTAQQAPAEAPSAPPVDPDAAKYAELAKELGVEQEQQETEEPASAEPEKPSEPAAPAERAKPEHVPYGDYENVQRALKEAREAAKAEQARTDAILAALREAKERRGQAEPAKQQEAPKLPEVQEDPIGHFQARLAQMEQALQHTYQGAQQQAQQTQAQLQEQAMWRAVEAAETAIRDPRSGAAHKADYDDACRHLETARIRQLDRMYPSDNAQMQAYARQQGFQDLNQYKLALLDQDRRAVAVHALQTGISPAQLYYDLALDSGYQAKTAAKPNGQAQQQIEAAKKGTRASTTLSGGSSSRKGAEDMSITDLSQLFIDDPEAADKIWDQMAKAGKL